MANSSVTEIEAMLARLTPAEQLGVVERLAHRLRLKAGGDPSPVELYGAWRDGFPVDFDLDVALKEIRGGWGVPEAEPTT